jgi:hypothetical protein
MFRRPAAIGSALLVILVGAGIQLAAESATSAAPGPPGQISVTPATVEEGSTGNSLTFVYAPGDKRLSGGTMSVKIPKDWTPPRAKVPETPGDVEVSSGKLAVSNRVVTVSDLTLCKTCWLTLIYSDVTAPATPGSASFLTKAARTGEHLEPLTPAPTVVIDSSSLCNPTVTTSSGGPPTLTADPGTCLSGGTPIAVTGVGYDAKNLGIILQCNNAANQPTVALSIVGSLETLPVSCTGLALANAITTSGTGGFSATWDAIEGVTGPPCGKTGDLVATCPADSSGGNAATDAANYPCPPTAAELAVGDSCTLSFGDQEGKTATVPISFVLAPPPLADAAG